MSIQVRKAVVSAFGGPENITVVDSTLEAAPANHVQIKVFYSGFSGADVNMRQGTYPFQRKAPLTPGYCLVGKVVNNGSGAKKFKTGDIVGCLSIYDAEATFCNMPEKHVFPIPDGLDYQQACGLILDWNTAYGAIKHGAEVKKGDKVFIHGMSGAVGYALMMLSMMEGAEVYGTASQRNHKEIEALGARPFVYTDKNWMSAMKEIGGVNAVFDALGYESWDESYEILAEKGILVGYGNNLKTVNGANMQEAPSPMVPIMKLLGRGTLKFWDCRRTVFYYISRDKAVFNPDLQALFELHKEGKIHVPVKKVWDLDNIQEAHKEWSGTPGMGSLFIKVAEPN